MATLKKARKGKSPKPRSPAAPVVAGYGVFLEGDGCHMPPVLLRRSESEFDAIGWRYCWHIDAELLAANMVVRPIDANGNAIDDEEGGDE